jgi:hypothetical protein
VAIKKQEKKTLNQSSLVPTIISLIYCYYYYFTPVNQILLDMSVAGGVRCFRVSPTVVWRRGGPWCLARVIYTPATVTAPPMSTSVLVFCLLGCFCVYFNSLFCSCFKPSHLFCQNGGPTPRPSI